MRKQSDIKADIEDNSQDILETQENQNQNKITCPVCGKTFSSASSLKGHMMRAHRTRSLGPPSTVEPQVPDAISQLHNFLRVFGLSERDSQAVLKYMESYSLDDLVRLNMALRDIGLAYNRRKLLIESWANVRNIAVPLPLQRELGIRIQPMQRNISVPSYGPSQYGFEPSSYGPREDFIDKLIKWEELKLHAQTPSPNNPLESQYQQQVQSLREEIRNLQASHSKEVESLKEELRRKEQERFEERIRNLESQIRILEGQRTSDYKLDEYRVIADSLRTIGSKNPVKEILDFFGKHPELFSMAYGERPQRQVPPQARRPLLEILRQKGLVVQE